MMEMATPTWLDLKFLTRALEDISKNGPINVLSFSTKPALAHRDGFTSYLFRVRVEFKSGDPPSHNSLLLMVKVPCEVGFVKELSEKYNFFCKEPIMYNEVLPTMETIEFIKFGPKSLYCPVKNVLVLTDLTEEGYITCEKYKQLDYSHCKTVIEKVAKFHAASVACLRNNQEIFREVGEYCCFDEGSSFEPLIRSALKNIVQIVSEDEKCALFSDYLTDRVDQTLPSCSKLTKPKTNGGLNVLNHGDLWLNNLMFKYSSSGEIVDVKFIDFQHIRLASPVNDLIFFVWTSANEDVREKRLKELLNFYLNTLNTTLEALGCEERLSVEELREDLFIAVDWAIVVVAFFFALQMAGPEDVPDFANLSKEDFGSEKFTKVFRSKDYNKLLPRTILSLSELFLAGKGMLDQSY